MEGGAEEQKGPIKLDVKQENQFALIKAQNRMFIEVDLLSDKSMSPNKLPVNFSIVIDRSGSMLEKGKLEYVKEAVSYLVGKLGEEDTLSIITYADDVKTIIEQGPVLSKEMINNKLMMIMGGGWTNLSGGLEEGVRQVLRESKEGEVNRVPLLSDGIANRGITDLAGLKKFSSDIYKRDITVSTIGVGADYDEEILRAISDNAGGNYYYISRPAEIPDIYAGELKSVFNTVAKDAKLSIRLTSGVQLLNLFGYDVKQVGSDMFIVDLGTLSAGEDRWVLMELELPYMQKKERMTLGSVWFGYKDVSSEKITNVNYTKDMLVRYTDSMKDIEKGRNIDVINVAMLIIAQNAKERAQQLLRVGDLLSAANVLKEQNEMISQRYNEMGITPPPPVSSEMANVDEDARYLEEGAFGGGLSKDELSSKSKELDYESYKKTRKKENIR
ncbi:MAG: vWA domain-containing protein [bacterium]